VVQSEDEAIETYAELLSNEEKMKKAGNRARERVLREHTFRHRAAQLRDIINSLRSPQIENSER